MTNGKNLFVILLESYENVLKVIINKVNGEFSFGIKGTHEIAGFVFDLKVMLFEGWIENGQIPFIVEFIVMFVNQFVYQIYIECMLIIEHFVILHNFSY